MKEVEGIKLEPWTEEEMAGIRERGEQFAKEKRRRGGVIPPPASRSSVADVSQRVTELERQVALLTAQLHGVAATCPHCRASAQVASSVGAEVHVNPNGEADYQAFRRAFPNIAAAADEVRAMNRAAAIQAAYDHDGTRD